MSKSRRTPRLGIALGAVLAVAAPVPASALGAGGTYEVLQCHELNRGSVDAIPSEPRVYWVNRFCDEPQHENSLQINSLLPAQRGKTALITWTAPAETGFIDVRLEAKLRRADGHKARLYLADEAGRETERIAVGDGEPSTFQVEAWGGSRQGQLVASLGCEESGGCPKSDQAKTWVRDVRLTLADYADPVVEPSGSLLSTDWMRGSRELSALFSDGGSGLAEAGVRVNGAPLQELDLACAQVPGDTAATRLKPCGSAAQLDVISVSTADAPFYDGDNAIAICADDFAGNQTCDRRTIRIDNKPPTLGFTDGQKADDPELIRAVVGDGHSGVASGQIYFRAVGESAWRALDTQLVGSELRARVDSAAEAEGDYEFMAAASDLAGNQTQTTLRQDGLPMVLHFPLRSGVDLSARIEPGGERRVIVGYARSTHAAGRLVAADGAPLAHQEVTVEEYFGEGALIDRRVRTVRTGSEGRWRSRLPAGPSRSVKVYFAGDQRYLGEETSAGALAVKTRARFRTSRRKVPEGRSVIFKGRIARRGARIPNGGKVVELQVRERPGRWNTVREAFRTRPMGRYRMRYRFGRFYAHDTRFTFRVKVSRQSDWPYKAPVSSRKRKVTVLNR
jgi:hypothetical protein